MPQPESAPSTPLSSATVALGPKTYRVGSLIYDRRMLLGVCAWLLWGDFCFVILEQGLEPILPIILKKYAASNGVIGIVTGSLSTFVHMIIGPVIGYKSDR